MSIRQMQADLARMEDALGFIGYVVGRINDEHGGQLGASVNIGGDPSLISVTGRWESLGAYAQMREAMMADGELQSAIRVGGGLFESAQDMLGQVRKPAGDRDAIAAVNVARMHLPRVADAIPFAMEVATVVENITGNATGVATAVTGDRTQLMWFGFSESLDAFAADQEKLEAEEEYIGLYKRSEDLFEPGSLEQSLWQMIA